MASIIMVGRNGCDIDYSLVDGRVRQFTVFNDEGKPKVLYDEDEKIATQNWETELINRCNKSGLVINDGRGFHAFILKLAEQGKLELEG